jgi:broad specificity phosphatase PhoE
MAIALLIRHGRTSANATGVLAGRTAGVSLDDKGVEQARTLSERLSTVVLAAVISSPLERTRQTADALLVGRNPAPPLHLDERVMEADYGDWTNQKLATLAKDPLWKVVQAQPSAVVFPQGEAMVEMASRAVTAVREWDARISDEHGPNAVFAVVSHGDVIKAITADALGMHLDSFQRLSCDPCSLTAVRYTAVRPFVLRMNDTGGSIDAFMPPPKGKRGRKPKTDAAVGGGAGH